MVIGIVPIVLGSFLYYFVYVSLSLLVLWLMAKVIT